MVTVSSITSRTRLAAAKTRSEFHPSAQRNSSIILLCVNNPDRSPIGINRWNAPRIQAAWLRWSAWSITGSNRSQVLQP